MAELNLQSLLHWRSVIYSTKGVSFMMDLIYTIAQWADNMEQSEVYNYNHGSDNKAI